MLILYVYGHNDVLYAHNNYDKTWQIITGDQLLLLLYYCQTVHGVINYYSSKRCSYYFCITRMKHFEYYKISATFT
jgi:hypothetical protein